MDISSITPTVHRTFQQLGHGTVAQRAAGLVHKVVPNGLGCHLDPNFKRMMTNQWIQGLPACQFSDNTNSSFHMCSPSLAYWC